MTKVSDITILARSMTIFFCLVIALSAAAQKYSVVSVIAQKNDVSAFITPVRDLNGQACALLKVEAPKDFAFSTPLGIVKRVDEVGEIWLYLPEGSAQITVKHPDWGVIRNYRFPTPLESHICYVMKLKCPKDEIEEIHDTVVVTQTLRDTVEVKYRRPKLPLASYVLLTASMHKTGPSFGVFLATMKRHGLFIHARSDFRMVGNTDCEVNSQGYITGNATGNSNDVMPFYTGKERHANWLLTAGFIHRLGKHLNLFEGAGYGKTSTAWQMDTAEGNKWALCTDHSHKGIAAEAGLMLHNNWWSALVSASTLKGKMWQVNIGIGIKIGKK